MVGYDSTCELHSVLQYHELNEIAEIIEKMTAITKAE